MKLKNEFTVMKIEHRRFALFTLDNGESKQPYRVNKSGARLLELLREEHEQEELLAILRAEYEVDEKVLAADVEEYLADLRALGFLQE